MGLLFRSVYREDYGWRISAAYHLNRQSGLRYRGAFIWKKSGPCKDAKDVGGRAIPSH